MRAALAAVALVLASTAAFADVAASCKAQSACRVAQQTAAGQGQDGADVAVVELVYEEPPAESWAAGLECRDGYREFWVVDGSQESLLLELCNDGYGAAGVGEDAIEIGNNRLMHYQVGGSAWRWGSDVTYQLSPLGILHERSDGYWTLGANYSIGEWDWTDYAAGENEWWSPFCDAEGYVPDNEGALPEDAEIQHYLAIPRLYAESVPPGIFDASLGNCSLTLSTETGRGWLVHGDAAEAAADAAWMRLLAYEPNRLAVSVRLPRLATGGRSWLSDDHIEIWQGPTMGYGTPCIDPQTPARQWAVRLSDGAVFAAHGEPTALPRVLARHSTLDTGSGVIVTLHLELSEPMESLTVVLSRGDGKAKQRWLLASSQLAFGKAWTLGDTWPIPAEAAACAISEGRLDVTRWYRPTYAP